MDEDLANKYHATMHIEDEAERILRIDLDEIVWPPREESQQVDPNVAVPVRLPEYVPCGHFRFHVRPGLETMVEMECTIDRQLHHEALVRVMALAIAQAQQMKDRNED